MKISSKIQIVLMGFYVILCVAGLLDHAPAKALYWFGALILSLGVLWM